MQQNTNTSKTAFRTRYKLYEYNNVMPCLTNDTAAFMQLMTNVLRDKLFMSVMF